MQFSIFNVPFKCTKDMFTQDKILWTIYIFWAQFWRTLLIIAGIVVLMTGYFGFRGENFTSLEILPMVIVGVFLYALIIYMQYYAYFNKQFKSFNREFLTAYKPDFFSWGFFKPFLLIWLMSFVAGLFLGIFLPSNIANGLSFIFGIFFQHICIHGETWGFKLSEPRDAAHKEL